MLFKVIHILHPHVITQKITGHILKSKQNNIYVCIHEIIRLIIILCYVMLSLFTFASLQLCSDSRIASLEANQNRQDENEK